MLNLNVSEFLKEIEEVKKGFKEVKEKVEKLLSFYEWYLEDMEIDVDGCEWEQVFPLRARLQEIFRFLLPGTAVTAGKEREYRTLARKLRMLDVELQKCRDFLREVFDFESYRREEVITEKTKKIPEKLWWYYLDSENVPDFTIPFWLRINRDFLKFKAVIVEGLIRNRTVNVLLFTPVLVSKKKREQLEGDIFLNMRYDYPTFVYNKLQVENVNVKAHVFVLPVSGLLANLHVTFMVEEAKLFNRRLVVAFPKEEGVFKTKFFKELREALFKGNIKFLNRKTLKEEEFDFFDVETLIGTEIYVRIRKDKKETPVQDLLQPKKENIVGDVVLVG